MDLPRLVTERREQILNIAAKYGANEVRVFGSVARGDFNDNSDIDILITLDSSHLPGMRYFGVLEEMEEELQLLLGRKVDLVDEKGLRDKLRAEVLKQARAL